MMLTGWSLYNMLMQRNWLADHAQSSYDQYNSPIAMLQVKSICRMNFEISPEDNVFHFAVTGAYDWFY